MSNLETSGGVPLIGQNELADKPLSKTQPTQIDVDDSQATAHYANFCRVSGLPEELLIDFGLNPQPIGNTTQSIEVGVRTVIGWQTAKRLVQVLQLTIERHEAAFGVLETDVQKRVQRL